METQTSCCGFTLEWLISCSEQKKEVLKRCFETLFKVETNFTARNCLLHRVRLKYFYNISSSFFAVFCAALLPSNAWNIKKALFQWTGTEVRVHSVLSLLLYTSHNASPACSPTCNRYLCRGARLQMPERWHHCQLSCSTLQTKTSPFSTLASLNPKRACGLLQMCGSRLCKGFTT